MNLTRHPDWDRRLARAVARHAAVPGQWGISDCWTMTMDAIEAVTGARILPGLRRYRTEAGGYRVFARAGLETVEAALASVLEPVGRLTAQRGDVGTIERGGVIAAGVFTADGFAVRAMGEGGSIEGATVRFEPVTLVRRAFRVGR